MQPETNKRALLLQFFWFYITPVISCCHVMSTFIEGNMTFVAYTLQMPVQGSSSKTERKNADPTITTQAKSQEA